MEPAHGAFEDFSLLDYRRRPSFARDKAFSGRENRNRHACRASKPGADKSVRALASLRYGFRSDETTQHRCAQRSVSPRAAAWSPHRKYAAPVDVWLARMHGAAPKVSDTLNTLPCAPRRNGSRDSAAARS